MNEKPKFKHCYERNKLSVSCNIVILEEVWNSLCVSVLMHWKMQTNCLIWNIHLDLTRMKDSDQFSLKCSARIPSKLHVFVELAFPCKKLLSSGILSLSLTRSNKMFSHLKFITWSPDGRIREKIEGKGRRAEMPTGCAFVILFVFS